MGSLAVPLAALIVVVLATVASMILGLIVVYISKGSRDRRERRQRAQRDQLLTDLTTEDPLASAQLVQSALRGRFHNQVDMLAVVTQSPKVRSTLRKHASRPAQTGETSELGQAAEIVPGPGVPGLAQWSTVKRKLVRQLEHRKPEHRGVALILLGYLGFPDTTSALVQATTDIDPDVRQCSVRALGLLETPAACGALIHLLSSRGKTTLGKTTVSDRRIADERIIERLAGPAYSAQLWEYVADYAPTVAAASHETGEREDDEQALGVLRALAAGDSTGPAEPLIPWLLYGTRNERVAALRSIAKCCSAIPDEVIAGVSDHDVIVAAQSAAVLAKHKLTPAQKVVAIPALSAQLHSRDWWVRRHSAHALGTLGPAGVEVLQKAVSGDDRYAAERAAEELQVVGAPLIQGPD